MAAATGLYRHIEDNRRRSLQLFLMFAVAFQLMAAVALFIPLLILDPDHAPLVGSLGYLRRYVPVVALLSMALFAAQMWWFVGGLRQALQFRYVDNADEPRFCRLLEPLAMAAGIRIPFAGVIESPALNAFAAGVRDDEMVVVVTRGLLNGLDDDELAGTLANCVIHIRNRDTRLLASATVFMRNMVVWQKEPGLKLDHPMKALSLILLPMIVPVALVTGFLIQLAYRIGYASRALIGISRELIADAEAARLTLNPAALVSALTKIDRQYRIAGIAAEYDAMLMFGAAHGPLATHPTLEERTGALARTTGAMVLDTSRRADTRPTSKRQMQGQAADPALERIALLGEAPAGRGFWGAFQSVRDPNRNILGLDRRGVMLMAAALAGIAAFYRPDWRDPGAVAAVFDPRRMSAMLGVGPDLLACTFGLQNGPEARAACEKQASDGGQMFDHIQGVANDRNGKATPDADGPP